MVVTRGSVLFVDDEPRILQGLVWSSRRRPYSTATATSGSEAIAALERQEFDVVVSDQQMPLMTGVELLSVVAKRFPNTARVLLTGQATLPVALRAVNEGRVCRLLLKPCASNELAEAVGQALSQARLLSATTRLLNAAQGLVARAIPGVASPGMARGLSQRPTQHIADLVVQTFSRREREVYDLLARGFRVGEIAKALFVSPHTVRNHLKALFRKAGVHSQRELIGAFQGEA